MSVRFVDPRTEEIVYPEPFETPSDAITPGLGTNAPPVSSLVLNPLLAPATLLWDVGRPVETYAEHWPQAERDKLSQRATWPPVGRLGLQSPHLPWRIEVLPRTPNIHVTVFDVLATIYMALRLQITPGEWEQFHIVEKSSIVAARGVRVRECDPNRQVDDMFQHPRRIDTLGERTRFAGLILAPHRGPDSLDLELKRR